MKEKTADIDILEELKEWFNNFDLDSIKHKPEEYIQAISNLIAENKELKEEIKEINEEYNAEQKHEMENTIPKSKVKEVIKELEIMYDGLPKNPKEHLHSKTEYKIVIGVLQSLLGKE